MKIIFLDIDGVLNYYGSKIFDTHCVDKLRHIIKETNAKIVLISTWKVCLNKKVFDEASDKEKEELLKLKYSLDTTFTNELEIIDITEDYFENKEKQRSNCISLEDIEKDTEHSDWRSIEIKNWLEGKQIEAFVIIDDFNCKYDEYFPNKWVKTSFYEKGLSRELADKAVSILMEVH